MPMMQNPDGTITRLPYPGEPGYQGGMMAGGQVPGGQMPGMGYDTYMQMLRQKMRRSPQVAVMQMPAPPPRFPTPGRMDGARVYQRPARPGMKQMYGGM